MALFKRKNNKDNNDDDIDYEFHNSISEMNEDSILSGYGNDDDFFAEDDSDKKGDSSKVVLVIAIAVVVVFLAIFGFLTLRGGNVFESGSSTDSSDTEITHAEDAPSMDRSNGINVTESLGETYSGNQDGNPSTGTGAILSFDYQYYTERDASGVLANFNPSNNLYEASFIQGEIDKVPEGTEYSLDITPTQIGRTYDVTLTLSLPGKDSVSYEQEFFVTEIDGNFYVESFKTKLSES